MYSKIMIEAFDHYHINHLEDRCVTAKIKQSIQSYILKHYDFEVK